MFNRADDRQFHTLLPGVAMAPLSHGDKTLMVQFRLDAGAELPLHQHPYEQTGYLLSGRMRMTIGEAVLPVPSGSGRIGIRRQGVRPHSTPATARLRAGSAWRKTSATMSPPLLISATTRLALKPR